MIHEVIFPIYKPEVLDIAGALRSEKQQYHLSVLGSSDANPSLCTLTENIIAAASKQGSPKQDRAVHYTDSAGTRTLMERRRVQSYGRTSSELPRVEERTLVREEGCSIESEEKNWHEEVDLGWLIVEYCCDHHITSEGLQKGNGHFSLNIYEQVPVSVVEHISRELRTHLLRRE